MMCIWFLFLEWTGIALFAGLSLTTLFFISSLTTPERVARSSYHVPIPEGAENAGYHPTGLLQWFSVADHPCLFGISVVGALSAIWLVNYAQRAQAAAGNRTG